MPELVYLAGVISATKPPVSQEIYCRETATLEFVPYPPQGVPMRLRAILVSAILCLPIFGMAQSQESSEVPSRRTV